MKVYEIYMYVYVYMARCIAFVQVILQILILNKLFPVITHQLL